MLPFLPICTPPPLFGFIFHPLLTAFTPSRLRGEAWAKFVSARQTLFYATRVSLPSCSAGVVGRSHTHKFHFTELTSCDWFADSNTIEGLLRSRLVSSYICLCPLGFMVEAGRYFQPHSLILYLTLDLI
ncbi:hypothetical protein BDV09DRAFT_67072 [Aspergillus tetrazonus]